jgi:hypothetical protein
MAEQPVPAVQRITFILHAIATVCIGLPLVVAPAWYGSLFGYPPEPGLEPPLRAFGTMILGLAGLTSFYGIRAPTWEHVDFIVRGEMAYLALQTLVFVGSALSGAGPALGNWLFAAVSVVLFALYAATFAARPRVASRGASQPAT